ncbi:MAG: winged helix-turn-helix transcriptional regulator [Candidatus Glassbacteria bacterium]|nr:winged helix-turn-helix transcriptional regulator [Candidatus Glassbacteria bacterium]
MQSAGKLARIFKALSVVSRVKIIQLLKERTLCVNALAARLEITPAAVSQHLRVLRDADLLTTDKRGNSVHYQVNHETLEVWQRQVNVLLQLGDDS